MYALVRRAQRRIRSEAGQSLVVVTLSMLVVLGMAAFGIDVATWYAKHHQAQVVADAAALAAANCLTHPNTGPAGYTCSSSTDVTGAQNVAIYYAAQNGVTITASQVNVDTANGKVTVNASPTAPSFFAHLFGINNVTPNAHAAASWKGNSQPCATIGQNCDFMFANSSNCSTGSYVLIVSEQGSSSINGNIQTNGSLDASETGNGGGINGTGTYGPGSCTSSTVGGNKNPWNTAPPSQSTSDMNWPIDYSQDFPACGGTGELACSTSSQTLGTPSFCTQASFTSGYTFGSATGDYPVSGNVYCAIGSGVPSDPSTWNGTITIASSGNNTWSDTFVGGTIHYTGSGGDTFSSCGYRTSGFSSSACPGVPAPATANYPIFYAVGQDPNSPSCASGTNTSSTCAFSMSSTGNLTLDGDIFAPQGTASFNLGGNQSAGNTFIEANVINATLNGNFNGDGPPSGSGTSTSSGQDFLTQ